MSEKMKQQNVIEESETIIDNKDVEQKPATPADEAEVSGIERDATVKKKEFFKHYGLRDVIVFAICTCVLIANQFVQIPVIRWVSSTIAILSMLLPGIISQVMSGDEFTLGKALKVLTAAGLKPRVINGEIHWNSGGKENIVRVYDGGLLQLAREYQIGKKGAMDNNEKAAISTMKEICSIKVGVRRDGEDEGCLIFSAESLCPTGKLFKRVFADYVQALDIAEERQGVHLQEVLDEKRSRRTKIGFDYLRTMEN